MVDYPDSDVRPGPLDPLPPFALPPKISPRIGTHPVHSNPAVQAYHQNLSSHLHSLIRATPVPSSQALRPPVLLEAGRKTSDESISATNISLAGSGSAIVFSSNGAPALSNTLSSAVNDSLPESQRESGDGLEVAEIREDEEDEDDEDDEGPPQLTARPELHPRRSLMHVPPPALETPKLRYTADNSSIPQPQQLSSESREEELKQAWQAEGKRVWRAIPDGFALKMGREESSGPGSDVSGRRRSGKARSRVDGVGLGIGLTSETGAEREMEGLSIARTGSRATTNTDTSRHSSFSRSPLFPSSHVDTAAATIASTSKRTSSRPTSRQDRPLRDAQTLDEKEEYEAKRLARTERKRGELEEKIKGWRDNVCATSTEEDNQEIFHSDIIPTPLSPPHYTKRAADYLPPHLHSYSSLPFSNKAQTFSTKKQQPLLIVPPTPEQENPSSIFNPNFPGPGRNGGFSGGVDLSAKLRALEDLLGPALDDGGSSRPEHPDLAPLISPAHVGDATIKARRKSSGTGGRVRGLSQEAEIETPRPGSGTGLYSAA